VVADGSPNAAEIFTEFFKNNVVLGILCTKVLHKTRLYDCEVS